MPRGVPKSGFRAARNSRAEKLAAIRVSYDTNPHETDDQLSARIAERFDILDVLT